MSATSVVHSPTILSSFVNRHPVASYAVLTIALAWVAMLAATQVLYVPLVLLTALAPVITALMISTITREATPNLRRLLHAPSGIQWYVLLSMPLLWGGIFSVFDQLATDGKAEYALPSLMLFTTVITYALWLSEQVGWRGYLLTKLQQGHSAWMSSAISSGLVLLTLLPLYLLSALVETDTFLIHVPYFAAVVAGCVWAWQHTHVDSPLRERRLVGRIMRSVGRGVLALLVVIFVMFGTAYLYQRVADAGAKTLAAPGTLYEIDGYRLHLQCTGTGTPTVILEAGAGGFSSDWYWVQQEIGTHTRVCSYDRNGYGWSDPAPTPSGGLKTAQDLHTLLARADIQPPYVMVGHSLGGQYISVFTHAYPAEVVGMVLVDAAHPDQWEWTGMESEATVQARQDMTYAGMVVIAQFGVFRPYSMGLRPGLADEANRAVANFWPTTQAWNAVQAEFSQWATLAGQARTVKSVGDIPLILIRAPHLDAGAAWADAYDNLAKLSTNHAVRVVEGADHGSIVSNPQYAKRVSQAILDVVQASLSGTPLAP